MKRNGVFCCTGQGALGTASNRPGSRGMYLETAAVQQNPGAKCRKLPEYLTPDEIKALLSHAERPRHRLLMLSPMWRAGLRVSEALALRPSDLEWPSADNKGGVIRVNQGKGNKDRLARSTRTLGRRWRPSSGTGGEGRTGRSSRRPGARLGDGSRRLRGGPRLRACWEPAGR